MPPKRSSSDHLRRPRRADRASHVHQVLVVLANTDPLVWRRIQVPDDYSFWDLHVAIQDAMGWQDSHLHEFAVINPRTGREQRLGIPDGEDPGERPCLPDWQARVSQYLTEAQPLAQYVYDFGDDWRHVVTYEGTWPAESGRKYPACLAGARACPPEDCGGVGGFAGFLAAVADPKHPEHADLLAWAGGRYDPEVFDAAKVRFDDPRDRFKLAFEE
jgi:hypothetical protein